MEKQIDGEAKCGLCHWRAKRPTREQLFLHLAIFHPGETLLDAAEKVLARPETLTRLSKAAGEYVGRAIKERFLQK
jgi:hypothetical protein